MQGLFKIEITSDQSLLKELIQTSCWNEMIGK